MDCHTARSGQHTVQILGNHGDEPEESTRSFNELTRANKDKANDAMFASIKIYDWKNRGMFEDWIDEIDQACRVSGCDFRMEIIKKLKGAVHQVVMSCENHSDDKLLSKLRSSFSDAPPHHEPFKGGTEKYEMERK